MKRLRMVLVVLMSVLLATAAMADCPELIELDCGGGYAWFGLRHDGANIGQGQTVTLECYSAVLSAEFYFRVTGLPNGDVPSMVAGDEIHMVVIDADGNHLMTATSTVPADVYTGWISFEFPEDSTVPAGVYSFAAYTTVPRQCSAAFCPSEDLYADGVRISSSNGLEGPWSEFFDGHDIPFRVFVNPDLVPAAARSLSHVKDLFR